MPNAGRQESGFFNKIDVKRTLPEEYQTAFLAATGALITNANAPVYKALG
jgi:hypothetical protein